MRNECCKKVIKEYQEIINQRDIRCNDLNIKYNDLLRKYSEQRDLSQSTKLIIVKELNTTKIKNMTHEEIIDKFIDLEYGKDK